MDDEKWHVAWVRDALRGLEDRFGRQRIRDTLAHYEAADAAVYAATLREQGQRADALVPILEN